MFIEIQKPDGTWLTFTSWQHFAASDMRRLCQKGPLNQKLSSEMQSTVVGGEQRFPRGRLHSGIMLSSSHIFDRRRNLLLNKLAPGCKIVALETSSQQVASCHWLHMA